MPFSRRTSHVALPPSSGAALMCEVYYSMPRAQKDCGDRRLRDRARSLPSSIEMGGGQGEPRVLALVIPRIHSWLKVYSANVVYPVNLRGLGRRRLPQLSRG